MTKPIPTPPAPTKWSDLDTFLKAAHLPPKGAKAVIEKIEFQTVHPRPNLTEIKPVMYFSGKKKALILNSTNQKFLRENYGDEITAGYGMEVLLMPTTKVIAGRKIETIVLEIPWQDMQPVQDATTPNEEPLQPFEI